jgi:tetratricopeptide (TPR) repeat protein
VDESLPLSVLQRLAQACDRFEDAWQAGARPRIEDFLGDSSGAERTALLRHLLGVELHHRGRLGERPRPEEYHGRFPAHGDVVDTAAHYNLGVALADKKDLEGAIACYRKAITADPKYAGAHNNLGVALEGKGKVDEAIASYRKAIALDPKSANAHGALGHVLQQQGRFAQARAATQRCLELLPPATACGRPRPNSCSSASTCWPWKGG